MKTFFITGCNKGIGLGLVREVLSHGHRVIATCRKPSEATALNQLLSEYSKHLSVVELDVVNDASIARLQSQCATLPAVDVLINSAGICKEYEKSISTLSMAATEEVFRANTMGPMHVVRSLLPALHKAPAPVIVQISSTMGSIANNTSGGAYAYRMSKASLNMFNKTLAIELPQVVCVVCHPGWVKTEMGGEDAQIDVQTSVSGLYKVISGLGIEDSGGFFDYQGNRLPW